MPRMVFVLAATHHSQCDAVVWSGVPLARFKPDRSPDGAPATPIPFFDCRAGALFFCLAYSGCRFLQHFDNSCDPGSKVREKSLVIHCKAGHELLVTLTRYVVRSPQCLLRIAHFW